MKDRDVYELNNRKDILVQELQQINIESHRIYHNLESLGDPHQEDL